MGDFEFEIVKTIAHSSGKRRVLIRFVLNTFYNVYEETYVSGERFSGWELSFISKMFDTQEQAEQAALEALPWLTEIA